MRNLFRYTEEFSHASPELVEDEVFRVVVPYGEAQQTLDRLQVPDAVTMQDTMQDERMHALLEFCKIPRSRDEIQLFLKLKNRDYVRVSIIKPLLEQGKLFPLEPNKPNSPKQKYKTAF